MRRVTSEDWYDYGPMLIDSNGPQVIDRALIHTGLLDAHGNPIMKGPRPIGFGRDIRRPYVLEWPH